jgi:hypothetical protein
MGKFNGKGPEYCIHCDQPQKAHSADNMACPLGTGFKYPTANCPNVFYPQNWNCRDEISEAYISKGFDKASLTAPMSISVRDCHITFDDYFIAILNGLTSGIASTPTSLEDYEALIDDNVIVNLAFELTIAAIKKREEYLGDKKENRNEKK